MPASATPRKPRTELSSPNAKYGRLAWGVRRDMREKGSVPIRYWAMWLPALGLGLLALYVLLTPIWIGLRALAWVAELRARARR